jgi:hypothetical protein
MGLFVWFVRGGLYVGREGIGKSKKLFGKEFGVY